MLQLSKIARLDPNTINQIAAGEVIERPSAVVKELVENSIDAGSTRIEVEILGAGKELIRVSDNGTGMSAEEVMLCLERHATSKISSIDDLQTVRSLGFRGEAIPSIGSVSRMTIASATEDGLRHLVKVDGGTVHPLSAGAGPKGTEIRVEDLFFNTPARLKFLKSDTTEVGQMVDLLMRYAVGYPSIGIKVTHGGQHVFSSPGNGSQLDAIAEVWGRENARALIPVDGELGGLRVVGFISPPHITKSTRSSQYLYVNGRPMRSRVLSIALDQAFRDLTPERRYPLVVLDLLIDPGRIDINVSPTKSEVKFQHDGLAFETLRTVIHQALMTSGMMPSAAQIAIANEALRAHQSPGPLNSRGPLHSGVPAAALAPLMPGAGGPLLPAPRLDSPAAFEAALLGGGGPFPPAPSAPGITPGPLVNPAEPMPYIRILDDLRIIGQAMNTFIIAETRHGLVLVDQHVAHERILYEYLCGLKRSSLVEKQSILVPQTLQLDRKSALMLADRLPEFESVGFELEPFGGDAFLIRAVPAAIGGKDPVSYLHDLVDELLESAVTRKLIPTREQIWIMNACKMAVKAGDPLTKSEMEKLLVDLATTENPYHCPHGRPITATLSHEDLLKLFKRI